MTCGSMRSSGSLARSCSPGRAKSSGGSCFYGQSVITFDVSGDEVIRSSVAVICLGISILSCEAWSADAGDEHPATYRATYRVEYRGEVGGTAEISATSDAEHHRYEFTSLTKMSGAFRLLVPDPVIERSTFAYEHGEVIPLEFSYEDGRKGDDDLRIVFDWDRNVAVTSTKARTTEVALRPGVLDRGSLYVAVMHDQKSGAEHVGPYVLADGDSLSTYEYEHAGEETVATGLGTLGAHRLVQRRGGSSRALVVWMAPSLSFLPVRMEQQKDGKTETSLILQSVEGLTPDAGDSPVRASNVAVGN